MAEQRQPILLVEDDSNDVLLIKRAFRKAQLKINLTTVADGDTAIAYLSKQPPYTDSNLYPQPALILLDLKLPRRSGLEVLQWLRQQPQLKRLLVVILTSSEENSDIEQAYELGANSYLVKPLQFEDLVALVEIVHNYWFKSNIIPDIIHS